MACSLLGFLFLTNVAGSCPEGQCAAEVPTALVQKSVKVRSSVDPRNTLFPRWEINLDLPPQERWVEFAKAHRDVIVPNFRHQTELYNQMTNEVSFREFHAAQHLDEEHELEMRGFIDALNDTLVDYRALKTGNYDYEMGMRRGCSGVLAAQPDGTMIHGRNLDIPIPPPGMQNEFIFTKNGKPLFAITNTYSGDVGMNTGIRYTDENGNGWTFEQNTRHVDGGDLHSFLSGNIMGAKLGGNAYSFRARKIMEETADFKTAVQKFEATTWSATHYFVLAGSKPWQGAIISANRGGPAKPAMNNVQVISKDIGRWYITAFNYDNMAPAQDCRRDFTNAELDKMGQNNVTEDNIMRLMRTPPCLFNSGTVLTWVSTPSKNTHFALHRDESLRLPSEWTTQ
eukprot:gnl/TRDRNA2_/TRDRNA2_80943_c0_seq1.p1 gnl/TRDRNA2_/TRDRNA2_80943_c0~~gnl/TRDRNA2_/TRDRNA2_80943_c0_seq1.p1  ORF type:complete len:398 (+),score=44.57 gnl/TRDRNA2_/TRDRNA2_80943_c0_seq1:66-1259(+)